LGDEFELVQAYLQLFKVRMGRRLRFTLDLAPELRPLPFPPMVLVTLAENAIKHGLAPADLGGTVDVAASRNGTSLVVTVTDDGVGFGASAGGTGVGLVNIRRQLAARYGDGARLTLEQQGGVCARIVVPWPPAGAQPRETAAGAPQPLPANAR
jgi:sensor histidine kinase YesM